MNHFYLYFGDDFTKSVSSYLFLSLMGVISLYFNIQFIKNVRAKRGAISSMINVNDLKLIVPASFALMSTFFMEDNTLFFISCMLIIMYSALLAFDAILFVKFRVEVNLQTIRWAITGVNGLVKGLPQLFDFALRSPFFLLSLFSLPVFFVTLVHGDYFFVTFLVMILIFIQSIGESFSGKLFYAGWVFLAWTNYLALNNCQDFFLVFLIWYMLSISSLFVFGYLRLHAMNALEEFKTTPTLIKKLFHNSVFTIPSEVDLTNTHAKLIAPTSVVQRKSPFWGVCNNANVILFTIESLGPHIHPYTPSGPKLKLFDRLGLKGWVSNNHFCLCPNTTVATNQIYTGHYSNNPYNRKDSAFFGEEPQNLQPLKLSGYKTLFLDSADIKLYDYHKLLDRVGFDKVWGTDDLIDSHQKADYRLIDMAGRIADEVDGGPFFLHIINDQTHMPYQTIDVARFNEYNNRTSKGEYLNALMEVDFILCSFLDKLSDFIDLSNTIIIATGDHGEAFGENGYVFHSNSIVRSQTQVPFVLYHPALNRREINHSCHFDIFPTLYDLLGIETSLASLGSSLGLNDRPFSYFFHSATLQGSAPANFGLLHNDEFFWHDRLFNQVSVRVNGKRYASHPIYTERYIKRLLGEMLIARGLNGA